MRSILVKDTGNMAHLRTAEWFDLSYAQLSKKHFEDHGWFQINITSSGLTSLKVYYPLTPFKPGCYNLLLFELEPAVERKPNPYVQLRRELYYLMEKKLTPLLDFLARKLSK